MSVSQRSRYCSHCQRKTLHQKSEFDGGMGCLLTLLTLGLFLIVWAVFAAQDAITPYRCQVCGKRRWF